MKHVIVGALAAMALAAFGCQDHGHTPQDRENAGMRGTAEPGTGGGGAAGTNIDDAEQEPMLQDEERQPTQPR